MEPDTDPLHALRPNYLRRLAERIKLLESLAQRLQRDAAESQTIADIHRTAHSMASSAAIYGYRGLSTAARDVETAFAPNRNVAADGKLYLERLITAAQAVWIASAND